MGRHRNKAALIAVIVSQLALLGYQVRREDGVSLLSTWTLAVLSPLQEGLHGGFRSSSSFWRNYFWLVGAREENERLRSEVERLKLDNRALARDLERTDRAQVLAAFRDSFPSKTLLAEVVGGSGNAHSREIIIDRGRADGVLPGMAVMTSEGVVGKVQASHRGAALVVMITDSDSGVGAILGECRVRGVLKGSGDPECMLEYVPSETPVRVGEAVYTSGEDRIFPKGLLIGRVTAVGEGADYRPVRVRPFAALERLDEVLVVLDGSHLDLPPLTPQLPHTLLPPPPGEQGGSGDEFTNVPAWTVSPQQGPLTEADRVLDRYRELGDAQEHHYGHGLPGQRPPDFNLGHPGLPVPPPAGSSGQNGDGDDEEIDSPPLVSSQPEPSP